MEKDKGFSLVEIAIVLIVISLLLAGIFSAAGLLRSTKTRDVISIADGLRAASLYFRERYGFVPGDAYVNDGEIPNVVGTPNTLNGRGNGNGLIQGTISGADGRITSQTAEAANAPFHLYSAGFIETIGPDTRARIQSSFGPVHLIAVGSSGINGYTEAVAESRNAIVFVNLPCDVANEVDLKLDDGNLTTGRARGVACANNVVTRYAVPLD